MSSILWSPTEQSRTRSYLGQFAADVSGRRDIDVTEWDALHQWSVENPADFWNDVWDFCGVIGDKGHVIYEKISMPPYGRFFTDSQISYAENMLRHAKAYADKPAIISRHEGEADTEQVTTWQGLYDLVSRLEQAMREAGVEEGDTVAAYLPNIALTDAVLLAASNIGAIFASADMDTGEQSLLDRFTDIAPKILFTGDGYAYKGKVFDRAAIVGSLQTKIPSIRTVVVVPTIDHQTAPDMKKFDKNKAVALDDFLVPFAAREIDFIRRDFNYPLFMLFSSGSTGKPKRFVHSSGGILIEMMCERMLHNDLHPGDVDFQHSKTTWMMWNFQNGALGCGATLLKHTGDSFYPDADVQWQFAADHGVTHFGSAAPLIIKWMELGLEIGKTHDLSKLRFMSSTGSVLPEAGFVYAHEKISDQMKIVSFSGGSDKCACCIGGNQFTPTIAGYIDGPTLGHDVRILDEDTGEQMPDGEPGELCFMNPTPSAPLRFHGDDANYTLYKEAYFDHYDGILGKHIWRHGDLTERTPTGGFVIHGRSDTTLNQYGVRFGTHMIYQQLEAFGDQINGATAVNYTIPTDKQQVAVLLLALDDYENGVPEDLEKAIRTAIRNNEGPNYVPAHMIAVPGTLTTLSGKNAEKVAAKALQGKPVANPNDYGENGAFLIDYLHKVGAALHDYYESQSREKFQYRA